MRINLENVTVVGVMPPGFFFANEKALIWVAGRPDSGRNILKATARLKPGVSIEQAQVAMETIATRRAQEYPETSGDLGVKISPVHDAWFTGASLRDHLFIFSCAVGFVLLIACANVAGLLLVRSSSRRKEMATSATGAGAHEASAKTTTRHHASFDITSSEPACPSREGRYAFDDV